MRVLVLGGTRFIGRTIVELLSKHDLLEIALFNRGISDPNLFPQNRSIIGDRERTADLEQVFQESWDVVIDCSGYFPKSVREMVNGLDHTLTKYIYISSCSVYDHEALCGVLRGEDAPILSCTDKEEVDTSPKTYGNRKAACERIIQNSGITSVIFRPALVFGPHDQTDRFYYWLNALNNGASTLLPEGGVRKFSMTYVSDLAQTVVRATLRHEINGVFNVVSYPSTSIKEVVEIATKALKSKTKILSASFDFLQEHDVKQWVDIPLWLHSDEYTYSNEKLLALVNIKPTSLEVGISETVAYYKSKGFPIPVAGMKSNRQQSLIQILENGE